MTDRQRRGGGPAQPPAGRVPPHDLASEESLIGAVLVRPAVLDLVLDVGIRPQDFYRPAHGHIYAAMLQLHAAGDPIDHVTVAGVIRDEGLMDAVGGPAVFASLMRTVPATSNARKYAHQILATAGRRRMLAELDAIADAVYSGRPQNGAVSRLAELADLDARGWRSGGLTVEWGEPEKPPEPAPVLVEGLLRVGEMCVFAAPRGIGKTFVTYNLAKLLADGHGRLMGTLEVQRPARVLLCQGELEPWQSHARWRQLGGKPVNVAETWEPWRIRVQRHRRPTGDGGWDEWTAATIDAGLEDAIVDHGVEVLVIDPWRTYFSGSENSNDEAEAALSQLTGLARRPGVAVVVIHHISGKTDFTKVLEPEDLWRGATRLADWASTRVTILPHYTARTAEEAGLSRNVARRHVDVHFLRRAEPTEDFCAVLDAETGWWNRWEGAKPGAGAGRGVAKATGAGAVGDPGMPDAAGHYQWVAEACQRDGGVWRSIKEAALSMDTSHDRASKLLHMAIRHGLLERFAQRGPSKHGYRLPSEGPPQLRLVPPPPGDQDAPPPDEGAPS